MNLCQHARYTEICDPGRENSEVGVFKLAQRPRIRVCERTRCCFVVADHDIDKKI